LGLQPLLSQKASSEGVRCSLAVSQRGGTDDGHVPRVHRTGPRAAVPARPDPSGVETRGHRVALRTGVAEAEPLPSIGTDASRLALELARVAPPDQQPRTRLGTRTRARSQFGKRAAAPLDPACLRAAVRTAIARRRGTEIVTSASAAACGPAAAADGLDQLADRRPDKRIRSSLSTGARADLVEGGQP